MVVGRERDCACWNASARYSSFARSSTVGQSSCLIENVRACLSRAFILGCSSCEERWSRSHRHCRHFLGCHFSCADSHSHVLFSLHHGSSLWNFATDSCRLECFSVCVGRLGVGRRQSFFCLSNPLFFIVFLFFFFFLRCCWLCSSSEKVFGGGFGAEGWSSLHDCVESWCRREQAANGSHRCATFNSRQSRESCVDRWQAHQRAHCATWTGMKSIPFLSFAQCKIPRFCCFFTSLSHPHMTIFVLVVASSLFLVLSLASFIC